MPQVPRPPVRYPSGASVSPRNTLFGEYPSPYPIRTAEYSNDFFAYVAADWTVTASTGSTALTAGNGGQIIQTTAATLNDIQHNLKNPACIAFTPGYQTWFAVNLQTNDLTSGVIAGLQAGGTAFAPNDGVYFTRASGSANVALNLSKGGVTTTLAAVTTLPAATAVSLGFFYDGKSTPTLYVFSSAGLASLTAYSQPYYQGGVVVKEVGVNASSGVLLTNLPVVNLSPAFGIQAGAAAAKTMTTDYLVASTEIARY
ncbi:MAG: hypothetical protein KGI71_06580 [Patescibacteria group bacterium]|nr:hypothetical protein [Patescibacteria group bacterium]